jgi:hypothetical protein
MLLQAKREFNFETEYVQQCLVSFDGVQEEQTAKMREQRHLNMFLLLLPEQAKYDVQDLEKLQDLKEKEHRVDLKLLQDFVVLVKQECVMDKYFFSFFDIPDMIVRHNLTRQNYDKVLKVLQKVKQCFLHAKVEKAIARFQQEVQERRRTGEEETEDQH